MAKVVALWEKTAHEKPGRASGSQAAPSRKRRVSQSLIASDPRRMIHDFFADGDERGPIGLLRTRGMEVLRRDSSTEQQLNSYGEASFFSVWRPTSLDAIRMMMTGRATGKSMNVKGKSAKTGALSGLVPFLQISEERHKAKLSTSPPGATVRVFYRSAEARAAAREALEPLMAEMVAVVRQAQATLDAEEASGVPLTDDERDVQVTHLRRRAMEAPALEEIDVAGNAGLQMPERLLVEAYVMRPDISHPPGWETGRPSAPGL